MNLKQIEKQLLKKEKVIKEKNNLITKTQLELKEEQEEVARLKKFKEKFEQLSKEYETIFKNEIKEAEKTSE